MELNYTKRRALDLIKGRVFLMRLLELVMVSLPHR